MPGWSWVGRVDYRRALDWQRARREGVIAGDRPEIIALMEHPAVVTLGRRSVSGLDGVRAAGIPIVSTERGGLATWHGPGQLVGYPIVDVGRRDIRVRDFVHGLEDALVAVLASLGLAAGTDPAHPGVWVGGRKIASVGVHFRKGVSMHGFALNATASLVDFDRFTPCGIEGVEMTSLAREGCPVAPARLASRVGVAVAAMVATQTSTSRTLPKI